jgi:hypothetical protein
MIMTGGAAGHRGKKVLEVLITVKQSVEHTVTRHFLDPLLYFLNASCAMRHRRSLGKGVTRGSG